MCLCGGVKNRIVTCEKCMFGEKRGMSKLGHWVAAKHTTAVPSFFIKIMK